MNTTCTPQLEELRKSLKSISSKFTIHITMKGRAVVLFGTRCLWKSSLHRLGPWVNSNLPRKAVFKQDGTEKSSSDYINERIEDVLSGGLMSGWTGETTRIKRQALDLCEMGIAENNAIEIIANILEIGADEFNGALARGKRGHEEI